jgi:hypothetical protein
VSAIEITEQTLVVARREAARRGVDVGEVVDEAVRRFVGGSELHRLLDELRREDADGSGLSEADAQRIAGEELTALRNERRPD